VIFLIPAYLSENASIGYFAPVIRDYILRVDNYFVENEKTARKIIKFFAPEKNQSDLNLFVLNKYSTISDFSDALDNIKMGQDFGVLSEAGLPCIADPGNIVVAWAHKNNIRVIPIDGPSSIILALVASGFNGQEFTFNGYLPVDKSDRRKRILNLESIVQKTGYTQIFMETPYRNNQLFEDLCKTLHNESLLCISTNISDPNTEFIKTLSISKWRKTKIDIHKKPTIFLLGRYL